MNEMEEISGVEISEKGLVTTEQKKSVILMTRKFNSVNNALGDLTQLEIEYREELKELNKKINDLTEKFKIRKKELRMNIKIISEKTLMKLGERQAYRAQIVDLGGKIKQSNMKKLIEQTK